MYLASGYLITSFAYFLMGSLVLAWLTTIKKGDHDGRSES